jgi:iron complex transport system substrate-binding protein
MRICSLVPGATEVIALLGLTDHLVGISHECDYPSSVRDVPIMVEPVVDQEISGSLDIDRQVKALSSSGQRLYRLHEQAFVKARPDTILAQDLCHVCAVTPDQLGQAIQSLPSKPEVMTLNPASLSDVINDVERIGAFLGEPAEGRTLAQSLLKRLAAVRAKSIARNRPRALCLEWLSPLYIGGHWVPEMVDAAGGQNVLGQAGLPSRQITWDEVRAAAPDIVVIMPCGFPVARTVSELVRLSRTDPDWSHALASWSQTYIVDANSYFSRPGPRLIDGVELLADIFHGQLTPKWDGSTVRQVAGSMFMTGPSL